MEELDQTILDEVIKMYDGKGDDTIIKQSIDTDFLRDYFNNLNLCTPQGGFPFEKIDRKLIIYLVTMINNSPHPFNEVAQQVLKSIIEYYRILLHNFIKFDKPNHVNPAYWAVIHITPTSKEVVAGYIEDNIFYIVFSQFL